MSKKSRATIAGAVAVALSGVIGSSAMGAVVANEWTGATSNDWNVDTNWSLGRVPVKGAPDQDNAVVNNITAAIPAIVSGIAQLPNDIILGNGAGTVGQINHSGGTASTGGGNWLIIGQSGGQGTYNLANPGGPGAVGAFTGMAQGTGDLTTNGGRLYVSGQGNPRVPETRGTFNVNTTGTVTVGNDMSIGAGLGTGTVNFDAGTINVGGWLSIGRGEEGPGHGNWNQSGGTLNQTNGGGRLIVAQQGTTGNLVMTGGTINGAGEMWIGQGILDNVRGSGTATISGNSLISVSNWIAVARQGGIGNLTISGNAVIQKTGTNNNHIVFGADGGGGTATVSISGNALVHSDTNIWMAEGANATVTQSGGTVRALGNLVLRQRNGTEVSEYNLTGGTLSVDGAIVQTNGTNANNIGTFNFTGGRITRSNAGVITYTGDLTIGNKAATIALGNNKTIAVSGILDVSQGVTFDLTGQTIPGGGGPGSIPLGTDGSIVGTFDPSTTTVLGLLNPSGATFISETAGEGGSFDPLTQSVFWVQESGGQVTLQYSVVPEPGAVGLLMLGGLGFVARRRRH